MAARSSAALTSGASAGAGLRSALGGRGDGSVSTCILGCSGSVDATDVPSSPASVVASCRCVAVSGGGEDRFEVRSAGGWRRPAGRRKNGR